MMLQSDSSSDDIAMMSEDDVMVVDSSSALMPAYQMPPRANRLLRQTRSEPWQPVPRAILILDVHLKTLLKFFRRLVFQWLAESWDFLPITFLISIMDVIFVCLNAEQR